MADFKFDLPDTFIKQLEALEENTEDMLKDMTKAGAELVYDGLKSNVPSSFHSSNIMKCLKITKTFKTPSDGGINTRAGFYGYFINKEGNLTPAPLVCNLYEYGRSTSPYPKYKFLKKSLNKSTIQAEMQKVQDKYIERLMKS